MARRGAGARWLELPDLAELVANTLLHFAGERYDLLAYVVMPSHFHWVFRPLPEWVASLPDLARYQSPREQVMHSIKTFTSRRCNEVLDRSGAFWQAESYDHWVRDADELDRIIRYIEENPVKAALVLDPADWRHSSAYLRRERRLPFVAPMVRTG